MKVFPTLGVTGVDGPGLGAGVNSGASVFPTRVLIGGEVDPTGELNQADIHVLGGIAGGPEEREAVTEELKHSGLPADRVTVYLPDSPSLVRALADLGVPEGEIGVYEDRARKGGGLVTVQVRTAHEAAPVREIFRRNHLEEVSALREP